MKELLIVFAKNQIKGKVKTRLASGIGDDNALKIYGQLLQHTLNISQVLPCDRTICYSNFIPPESEWRYSGFKEAVQHGDELGTRMLNALENGFNDGYQKIVIIGTDCLELTTSILQKAFDILDKKDIVIGPACDGGYYLLGMKRLHRTLFLDKPWSTEYVFERTMTDIQNMDLSYAVLEELSDIDTPEDLMKSSLSQDNRYKT